MSLELLKERFSGKPITFQYEEQIEDKEQIIEKLENETYDLSNQILTLKKEKNILLHELDKARHFEEGVFDMKEKGYINELQSKEYTIKEIKSEFNPLYKKIDKQKDRLFYQDDLIKKYKNKNKELNENINKLNYSLNFEKKNSKEVISEIELERKRTYQNYINDLDVYENTLISKNEIISSHKNKLKESLDKLKDASNLIINLKKDIKINENTRQELKEKNEKISNLNGEIYSLSEEVKHFSSLFNENNILYEDEIKYKNNDMDKQKQKLKENNIKIKKLNTKISNLESKNKESEKIISEKTSALSEFAVENSLLQTQLEKAESFQNIISNKKDKFEKSIKETSNLNISNITNLLTTVSRKKQGNQILTWNKWLDIPENNYLLNLDEVVAKKLFNQSNRLIQDAKTPTRMGPRVTKIHYGLDFDGEKQHLDTTFSENGATPTDRTYSWWMKSDETGVNKGVFGYGGNNYEGFSINYSSGRPLLYNGSNWYRYWADTPAQDDGNWHHWMVFSDVSDPSSCTLYVDTVEIATGTTKTNGSLRNHNEPLVIGASDDSNTTGEHCKCSITNFAVFTGDKTANAKAHYNNGIPKDLTNESDLEGYWKMDENTGTTVKDYSSDGNDGTFDADEPTWITVMKATDHIQSGIPFIENLTTGNLEDPR